MLSALFWVAGCAGASPQGPGQGDPSESVLLLVGDVGTLNASEGLLVQHLADVLGMAVITLDDDAIDPNSVEVAPLIVVSKTVKSDKVAGRLKGAAGGIVFWEDNQQQLSMLATIDNDGSGGTAWHAANDRIEVLVDAPVDLRAGLDGPVTLYTRPHEISYAPAGDLPPSAIRIARFREGDDRHAIYAYERGQALADGSSAAGRRVYFGLFDDTFRLLTEAGVLLFDAAIAWAIGDRL